MHPVEFLYYLGSSAKRHYSFRRQRRLPQKVISIGNITTGGTGKTPASIAVAQEAKRRGFSPVILTRGYGGRAKGPCFVTKGEGPLLSVEDAGDEPLLMAERLKDVPIVKGADRYEAGLFAIEHLGFREDFIFILDDGFQHWRLHRDRDIVLMDSGNPFGNRALLPIGRLREPLTALGRADIIVLSKSASTDGKETAQVDATVREIRRYSPEAPIFSARHRPLSCRLVSGERMPAGWLSGKRVFGFCGLGNPESFRKTVLSTGAGLAGWRAFRDHYRYASSDLPALGKEAERCGAEWIVTTEKDIIKIRTFDIPDNVVIVEVEFSVEADFYEEVFGF